MSHVVFSLALSMVPGVGNILAKQLFAYFGSAESVFKAPKGKLMKVPGIGEVLSNEIIKKNTIQKAEQTLKDIADYDAQLLFYYEDTYPQLLKETADSPFYIYWKGNASPNFSRSVAIVGTRNCTEYGKKMTEDLVAGLAPYHPTIISGFAYGIDIVAHREAIKHGLPTMAVLGSGFKKIYPDSHTKYVDEILENGAFVSEYELNTGPEAMHFPARNRIVAGMSESVIVVEAAKGGGALITADLANQYNREVFAIPGNIGNKYSEGCNFLIAKNQAAIYTNVQNLASDLGWNLTANSSPIRTIKNRIEGLSEREANLFHLISNGGGEMQIDSLAWKSQLNVNELASLLLGLELRGIVKVLPGKKYALC